MARVVQPRARSQCELHSDLLGRRRLERNYLEWDHLEWHHLEWDHVERDHVVGYDMVRR